MIDGQRVLGVIAARGGSKRVPKKNVRPIGGKPLIAWTIDAARSSRYLDRVILSSDDEEIIECARAHGCDVPFKRDAELAADDISSIDVVLDALVRCPGYDWVVLLQPTSPLRVAADIDAAIQHCNVVGAPACATVCEAEQSPYWMYTLGSKARLLPVLPYPRIKGRQDLPSAYILNGAVYVALTDWLMRERTFLCADTVGYVMPQDRSIDIDTFSDLRMAELALDDARTKQAIF